MPEILAPAGDRVCAQSAVDAGADAIYLGYSQFSARASAGNFDGDGLHEIMESAHFSGVKVYVAMNTLIKQGESADFLQTLEHVWETGADAIIMQDILLGRYIHRLRPDIRLHLSTQAGVCNVYGAEFAKECGFSRVILARETPLSEIRKISEVLETEAFVQGALCTCFSGQCYFSSFAGGNSGNRGRCKQPCRKCYSFDREGFEGFAYALSPSDLCVGERIGELRRAGVSSFKIEGRMRRAEYVAAAVRYYRALSDGAEKGVLSGRFSDLRRAYNRGDYTRGLAFGQASDFLSRQVQGHIGERVGVIAGDRGKDERKFPGEYFVKSNFRPESGDAFKILRDGKEAGGARFIRPANAGFHIASSVRLRIGDEVFVTTDRAAGRRALSEKRTLPAALSLDFREGRCAGATLSGGGTEISLQTEEPLEGAKNSPLTEEELKNCFLKTDGIPLDIRFSEIRLGNVFLAKSRLNAFRRKLYEKFFRARAASARKPQTSLVPPSLPDAYAGKNQKRAAIFSSRTFDAARADICADIVVFKPDSYAKPLPDSFIGGAFEKYLYLPAYAVKADTDRIAELVRQNALDGIYAENYGGAVLARHIGCKLFAGTGFNLTNAAAIGELLREPVLRYLALSKELDEREQKELSGANAFVLTDGGIKLMDLCYCPFGKSCSSCDRKAVYRMTDEAGRVFPVRRFVGGAGDCRFEIYNCADLSETADAPSGRLVDRTLPPLAEKTSGHRYKSVL